MPIKLAKAVTSSGINDEEGLERINISTEYAIMYQIALKMYIYIYIYLCRTSISNPCHHTAKQ